MKKGPSQSGTNSSKDLKCGERYPSFNWSEHADAHNSFSCQQNFLNANFLFSLPTQKPREGTVNARSMVSAIVDIQSLQSPQIKRAWETLSCLQGTGRNYLKPGISKLAVQNGDSEFSRSTTSYSSVETRRKTTLWSSSEKTQTSFEGSRNGNFGRDPNVTCSIARASNSTITNGNFLSQSRTSAPEDDRSTIVGGPDQRNRSMLYTSPVHAGNGNFNAHADHKEVFVESCLDDINEDDVLQNIDVDQIVLEHFQSASTPQSSRSKLPPVTPAIEIDNTTGPDEVSLPPELLTICCHGLMLALCQDAAIHLQEKKDTLIAISNELLDGIDNLNQMQIAKLRKDRLELNKQVQQLEKHLHSSAMDEERKVSHFSASTTASRRFQFEASSASASRIDPVRFDAQVHLHNEPGSFYKVPSPPSVSFTSLDNFHVPQGSVEREVYVPKPGNIDYIEGSNDRRWSGHDFPWTKKLEANNRKVFGNHSFRPNQREVINATMSKCDVFVLMPTGGGKSLTYQLPALICNGVTLVVCPLVSLIQDQIMHLLQANIPAAYLSANMEWSEQQDIFRELTSAHCKFKLLYVTPEKVAKSDVLLRQLESLHARDSLSRIVIDEAHCVSQWGHDFRPDYQGLGILKQKFPDTPVLALTATATADVKDDVVRALGLEKCIVFRQSFNRPNLWYSVIAKTKTCLDDIHKFIKQNHDAECGIIYCLSRMDCEKVAEKLQECGHKATFYHGSMEPQQRAFVQKQWSKDEVDIICATVAFGMGINKPDVRFVIHHSLPKSIEGYHQECGRAGRDGQRSSCVLYYSYSDYIRMKHMITQGALEQSSSTYSAKRPSVLNSDRLAETNVENLLRMVSYCENDTDCRRHLQLVHFGEKFDSANCQKTCDNCSRTSDYIEKDVTDTARQLVELVKSTGQHYSSNHILEVYRGSMSQVVKKYRHDILSLHGAGKHLGKAEVSRILRHLVTQDFLFEEVKKSDLYGNISSVLKVNESKACILCFGGHKINIRFLASTKSVKLNKSEAKVAKGSFFSGKFDYPASSPAQVQSGGDVDLQAHLFAALRLLRTVLLKEAGEGVMAYHIFGNAVLQQISKTIPRTKEQLLDVNGIGKAKVKKYGDRVLETIESTINEFKKANKSNSCGNDSSEGAKRRRQATGVKSCESKDDEDFIEISALSKKRATDTNVNQNCGMSEYDEQLVHNIDWSDSDNDMDTNCPNANTGKTGGRVLPSWSVPANKARN